MVRNRLINLLESLRRSAPSQDRHWPSHVLDIMGSKYHLRPDEMLHLWYIKETFANGKNYNSSLLIYDRVKAYEKTVVIRNTTDLYDLLVFRCKLLVDGIVKLQKISNNENN